MRILCVSPLFPPLADAEAFCGGKMVKALADAGLEVVVLCRSLSPERPVDGSSCWRPLERFSRYIDTPHVRSLNTAKKLRAVYYGLSYGMITQGLLIHRYVRYALQLQHEKSFDLVYSRSFPTFAHPVGYWCARRLGLPWIANINDPWDIWNPRTASGDANAPAPKARWRVRTSRYWLRRTLACADVVTYPSARLHEFQVQLSGLDHHAEVVPHIGYADDVPDEPMSKFTLVHTGLLQEASGRSARGLFAGLARFLRACPSARGATRVVLVGRKDAVTADLAREAGVEDVVECVGRVSYEESLRRIALASLCVLVEGKMTEGIYFPSKLADYIAARKPILALSPARGVVAELARKGGIRRVDTDDEEAIAAALGDFYRAFLGGRLQEHRVSDVLVHQVNPHAVVEKFLHATEYACRSCRKHRS